MRVKDIIQDFMRQNDVTLADLEIKWDDRTWTIGETGDFYTIREFTDFYDQKVDRGCAPVLIMLYIPSLNRALYIH